MLEPYKKKLIRFRTTYDQAEQSIQREQSQKQQIASDLQNIQTATSIVQHVATQVQQQVHEQLASIATSCLDTVFGKSYRLEIQFDRKRSKTEATIILKNGNMVLDDPMNQVGGGVLDVASLCLRLAAILLSKNKRRILVLDEPFKNIRGNEYRDRTRKMLLEISDKLGFQFIINTDIESFRLGKVLDLS